MLDIGFWKKRAEKYYAALPYHNFHHALEVLQRVEELLRCCEANNIAVNRDVVRLAALFHDAGYSDAVNTTKEAHSAQIAGKELAGNFPDKDVALVIQVILATQVNVRPKTVEEKILRAADISSFAAKFSVFIKENELLRVEHQILTGDRLSDDEWKQLTKSIIEEYLLTEMAILPGIPGEEFYSKTRTNVDLFLKT